MCARITLTTTSAEIGELFGMTSETDARPRYNVAPSQSIPVLRNDDRGGRELVTMRWGLIPHWNTDPRHTGFVNARAETAPEKPAFRDAFRLRRCLVPADGFYEWEHRGKRKQPYLFRKVGGGPLAYAAVWDPWAGPHGVVDTVAVLTTAANELVRPLHDRMPAILTPDHFDAWLDPRQRRADRLLPLLTPYPAEMLEAWPVSDRVNSATIDEPGLTAAVTLPERPRAAWTQPGLFDMV
jgi:putative SOS response-associated peptidase YedK